MNRFHRWCCRSESWRKQLREEVLPWALDGINLPEGSALEVGPGPGLTTDFLQGRVAGLTAVELDSGLARALANRTAGTRVRVVNGDATQLPLRDRAFSSAFCFTMLHHVASPALQDRLFQEIFRTLKPGGVFIAVDSRSSLRMKLVHLWDTLVIVDPDALAGRLERAGFARANIKANGRRFRCVAWRPEKA
ncbi:MAG: class I SAM-dependent methyltransferase [Terriglobia bacterium]